MKKFKLIAATFCMAAQTIAQVPTEMGLVGDYPFNNNAKDMSLSKNDGQVTGATLTKDRFGNDNSAYFFNGASYITFLAKNILNNYYSISAWVNISELPNMVESAAGIVNIGNVGGDQFLYVSSQFGFSMINYVKDNPPMNYSVGVLPKVKKWYHLMVTRSDKYMIFYLDGELKGLMTVQGFVPSYSNNPVGTFGARLNGSKQFFNGAIDDVKIYSRALSEDEVVTIYKADIVTSNNDYQLSNSVNIFQDSAHNNQFQIKTDQEFSGTLNISDAQGQVIFETQLLNLSGIQDIEISPAYKGFFIASISNDNGQKVRKKFIVN